MKAIVHIGYPKTGSTTLQTLMSQESDVFYLGKGPLELEGSTGLSSRTLELILCTTDEEFENGYREIYKEIDIQRNGKPIFLSDEGISYGFFMERHLIWGKAKALKIVNDPKRVASRIKKLFPHARVLINVRNQRDFIVSYYKQHAKIGATNLSFDTWFQQMKKSNNFLSLLDFSATINEYRNQLGSENVYLVEFESFSSVESRQKLSDFISDTLSVECDLTTKLGNSRENVDTGRMNPLLFRLKRYALVKSFKPLIPQSFISFIKSKSSIEHKLENKNQISEEISRFFTDSNKALLENEGIDYVNY